MPEEEKVPVNGVEAVNMPEALENVPVGEEGTVSEMVEEGDPMAITHGEKPVFDVQIKEWTPDGEKDEEAMSIRLILAKNKKFYQRGLAELMVDGKSHVVSVDALMSCFFNVYETSNPFRGFDPNKPVLQAFAIIKDEVVQSESEDGIPEGEDRQVLKRSLLGLTLQADDLPRLQEKHPEGKPFDMLLAIEQVDPHEEAEEEPSK